MKRTVQNRTIIQTCTLRIVLINPTHTYTYTTSCKNLNLTYKYINIQSRNTNYSLNHVLHTNECNQTSIKYVVEEGYIGLCILFNRTYFEMACFLIIGCQYSTTYFCQRQSKLILFDYEDKRSFLLSKGFKYNQSVNTQSL